MVTGDIFAGISLLISMFTIIYLVGFWKGGVDTKLNTLWQVYVMDALHNRPDLARRRSPLRLTDEGRSLIPESLRATLSRWPPFCSLGKSQPPAFEIIKCLGIEAIKVFSEQHQLTVQDAIALFTLYIDEIKDQTDHKGKNK